jgi:hypothetical protein
VVKGRQLTINERRQVSPAARGSALSAEAKNEVLLWPVATKKA